VHVESCAVSPIRPDSLPEQPPDEPSNRFGESVRL